MAEKPHVNIVTIGHVDHGKSTLVGRLLFDTGSVPETEMRKLKEKAKEIKKETFEFAFVMDNLKEEQERGVTIDLAYKGFNSDKYYYTIIDAPGHRDFVKNMITGTSQADAAILVVSGKDSVQDQTKEHIYLARVLGIKQIVIAINKMDAVNYDQAQFNKVKEDVSKILTSIGFKVDEVPFVPCSAYQGDNVAKKSENMSWYSGDTIVKTLDNIVKEPERPIDKPLRMPIQDVYSITGIGTVPVGRVESGVLKPNDKIVFMPSGVTAEVKSVEMHHKQLEKAVPGDNVGFNVKGISKKDLGRGEVVGHADKPPTSAKEFTGQIVVLQHPTVLTVGYTPVIHVHTAHVSGKITEIVKKMDPRTGAEVTTDKDILRPGDSAIVKIQPLQPLSIEKNDEFPKLAKFAIRDMGKTVAAGVCIDIVPVEKK